MQNGVMPEARQQEDGKKQGAVEHEGCVFEMNRAKKNGRREKDRVREREIERGMTLYADPLKRVNDVACVGVCVCVCVWVCVRVRAKRE